MASGYRLMRRAEADLDEIADFSLASWGGARAESYLQRLIDAFDMIAAHPQIGRLRPEVTPPVRLFQVERHLLICRQVDDNVEIVAITHERRNWEALGLFDV